MCSSTFSYIHQTWLFTVNYYSGNRNSSKFTELCELYMNTFYSDFCSSAVKRYWVGFFFFAFVISLSELYWVLFLLLLPKTFDKQYFSYIITPSNPFLFFFSFLCFPLFLSFCLKRTGKLNINFLLLTEFVFFFYLNLTFLFVKTAIMLHVTLFSTSCNLLHYDRRGKKRFLLEAVHVLWN